MREITVSNGRESELRAALDAQGLTTVDVSEPDGEGLITVSVPDGVDGVDGVLVDETLRRVVSDRMSVTVGYRIFVGRFSQAGLTDPEVTPLKNTLGGEPVWTRDDVGRYVGTLAGAFPPGRTGSPNKFQILSPPTASDLAMSVGVATEDSVSVETTTYSTGAFIDDALDETLVEIRVYDI